MKASSKSIICMSSCCFCFSAWSWTYSVKPNLPLQHAWSHMFLLWTLYMCHVIHGSVSPMEAVCVTLAFSHGKKMIWHPHEHTNIHAQYTYIHIHTHWPLISTLCRPTVGQMMSFTCGALGDKGPFVSVQTHTHTHSQTHRHTHKLTFLPVRGSRERVRLNRVHMWCVFAGWSGAFIIRFPSHSSSAGEQWGLLCCHTLTALFVKPVNKTEQETDRFPFRRLKNSPL